MERSKLSALNRRAVAVLHRFRDAEDGALIALSLYLFVGMLVVTGVAIEIMRHEDRRVQIQGTADRAALAAADLGQTLSPADVARDYFAKSGLEGLSVTPVVEQGQFGEWRTVAINVRETYPTFLAQFAGLNEMTVNAQSRAIESIGNVEISLVLDISGSMNDKVYVNGALKGTRISLLRSAAVQFVDTMFQNVQPPGAPAGRLGISVVPYNQQVVLGTGLASRFNISSDHAQNTCVDFFTAADFSTPAVTPTQPLQRSMYGASFDYRQWGFSTPSTWSTSGSSILNCPENSMAAILPFANNQSVLTNKINALTAGGDTAIDMGAKWGLALLDPAAQPVVDGLIAAGQVSGNLSERPYAYGDENTMKVLVLMTDGQNTRTYSTKPEFRSGESGLISTSSATNMSTSYLYYYDPSRSNPYYKFSDGKWYAANKVTGTKYPITYQTLWNTKKYTLQYALNTFLGKPFNNASTLYNQMAEQAEFGGKDTNLEAVCDAAKHRDRNVVIFSLAVDAPSAGQTVLRNCATAPAYFWSVTAAELDTAFAGIASAINSLRLTN
jgi:Flp pilus assembly protein TadG